MRITVRLLAGRTDLQQRYNRHQLTENSAYDNYRLGREHRCHTYQHSLHPAGLENLAHQSYRRHLAGHVYPFHDRGCVVAGLRHID